MDSLDMFRIPLDEGSRGPCKICETHQYRVNLVLTGSAHLIDAPRSMHNLLGTQYNECANAVCNNAKETAEVL